MRECVQQDLLGRFYEDFYRVVVQNERYDEWTHTLHELQRLFHEYPERVLHYHDNRGGGGGGGGGGSVSSDAEKPPPKAWNSNASSGNFLEVLNMALNSELLETFFFVS